MTNGSPPVTFTLNQLYPIALRTLRRAFREHGLCTPVELDVALRIKQELGAGLAPCNVLFVDDPALLLEGIVFHRSAALGIPQPVVISGMGRHTEVLVRSMESPVTGRPASAQDPLVRLQSRIVRAMETIAEREGAELLVSR
jgi:uncharacterized protein (DUF302 family)